MIEEYRSNGTCYCIIFRNNDRNRNFSRSKKKRILTFRPTIRVTIHFNPILEIRIRISFEFSRNFFTSCTTFLTPQTNGKKKLFHASSTTRYRSSKLEEARNEGGHPRILESTGRNIMKPPSIYLSSLKSVLKKKKKNNKPPSFQGSKSRVQG